MQRCLGRAVLIGVDSETDDSFRTQIEHRFFDHLLSAAAWLMPPHHLPRSSSFFQGGGSGDDLRDWLRAAEILDELRDAVPKFLANFATAWRISLRLGESCPLSRLFAFSGR